MANIRKRSGQKGVTYQVRYATRSARSGYAFKKFKTLKAARDFIQNLGSLPDRDRSEIETVDDAVGRWLDICEKIGRDGREKVEAGTLKEYRRRAAVMQEYQWGRALPDLRPADIVQFRNWLLENKTRDLARRTLSSLHSVLIEMKRQGAMDSDPAAGITIKSGGRYEDDDDDVVIPTDDEMRSILGAADRMGDKNDFMAKCWARYRPMVYLASFSGMRPSEYRGLCWEHVTPDAVIIRQRADFRGVIGPVKSKAGKRTIYLPRRITDMLFEWKKVQKGSSGDLVFPTSTGRAISHGNIIQRVWLPLLKEVGLVDRERVAGKVRIAPRYNLYALRHYYASKLIEKGTDLKFIQETMGHSRIEITLNVYGHLIRGNEAARKATAESLASELLSANGAHA